MNWLVTIGSMQTGNVQIGNVWNWKYSNSGNAWNWKCSNWNGTIPAMTIGRCQTQILPFLGSGLGITAMSPSLSHLLGGISIVQLFWACYPQNLAGVLPSSIREGEGWRLIFLTCIRVYGWESPEKRLVCFFFDRAPLSLHTRLQQE